MRRLSILLATMAAGALASGAVHAQMGRSRVEARRAALGASADRRAA